MTHLFGPSFRMKMTANWLGRAAFAVAIAMLSTIASAQTQTWSDSTTESVVTIDSGQLHYRVTKSLADNKTGWWDYTVSLSDVDCIGFQRMKTGDVLIVMGKTNDAVIKKADPNGTTHGYEAALKHIDIDFSPDASAIAESTLRDITGSAPELAKTINKGACTL